MIKELKKLSIDYEYAGVGHPVIGRIRGKSILKAIALRAEMDALPGDEVSKAPLK